MQGYCLEYPPKTSCLICKPGTYASSGDYCTSSSSCGCNQCPNGHVCPGEGTKGPQICQAGTIANYKKTSCLICKPGTYASSGLSCTSSSSCGCTQCPNGHVCPGEGTTNPQKCPAGMKPDSSSIICLPITIPLGF